MIIAPLPADGIFSNRPQYLNSVDGAAIFHEIIVDNPV